MRLAEIAGVPGRVEVVSQCLGILAIVERARRPGSRISPRRWSWGLFSMPPDCFGIERVSETRLEPLVRARGAEEDPAVPIGPCHLRHNPLIRDAYQANLNGEFIPLTSETSEQEKLGLDQLSLADRRSISTSPLIARPCSRRISLRCFRSMTR